MRVFTFYLTQIHGYIDLEAKDLKTQLAWLLISNTKDASYKCEHNDMMQHEADVKLSTDVCLSVSYCSFFSAYVPNKCVITCYKL